MVRLTFLLSVTVAALLVAVPAAPAAVPEPETLVRVELDLAASNGYEAHLETSQKRIATLRFSRQGDEATYSTQGKVSEEGLRVRFGHLGLIDVHFTPTTTLNSTEPSEECSGEPRTLREGVFTGTIEFKGEPDSSSSKGCRPKDR